jgi:hypothetical protein
VKYGVEDFAGFTLSDTHETWMAENVRTAILLVPLSNPSPERIDHRVLENRCLLISIAVLTGFERVLA